MTRSDLDLQRVAALANAAVVLFGLTGLAGAAPPDDGAPGREEKEKYVRDHIEGFLHPSAIEHLEDGRVRLVFELGTDRARQTGIFTPAVSSEQNSPFRWSLESEFAATAQGTGGKKNADGTPYAGGLRIAMKGAAHLNAWFEGDVEAEVDYVQATNHSARQVVAVVFTNPSGKSVGSNYGSQCLVFNRGRVAGRSGAFDPIGTGLCKHELLKNKLVIKDGEAAACRNGVKVQAMKYRARDFDSGRIGLIWAGGMAGFVNRLEVVGTLDVDAMYREIRRSERGDTPAGTGAGPGRRRVRGSE